MLRLIRDEKFYTFPENVSDQDYFNMIVKISKSSTKASPSWSKYNNFLSELDKLIGSTEFLEKEESEFLSLKDSQSTELIPKDKSNIMTQKLKSTYSKIMGYRIFKMNYETYYNDGQKECQKLQDQVNKMIDSNAENRQRIKAYKAEIVMLEKEIPKLLEELSQYEKGGIPANEVPSFYSQMEQDFSEKISLFKRNKIQKLNEAMERNRELKQEESDLINELYQISQFSKFKFE